jgi:hypothetical protein
VLLLSLGCSLVEPDLRDGTYELVTVDGRKPPSLRSATIECDLTVDGGTLVIGPGTRVVFDLVERSDCTRGGGGILAWHRGFVGTYAMNGGTLTISTPNPADIDAMWLSLEATVKLRSCGCNY